MDGSDGHRIATSVGYVEHSRVHLKNYQTMVPSVFHDPPRNSGALANRPHDPAIEVDPFELTAGGEANRAAVWRPEGHLRIVGPLQEAERPRRSRHAPTTAGDRRHLPRRRPSLRPARWPARKDRTWAASGFRGAALGMEPSWTTGRDHHQHRDNAEDSDC